jgi:hypothetical protein
MAITTLKLTDSDYPATAFIHLEISGDESSSKTDSGKHSDHSDRPRNSIFVRTLHMFE